jgi:hypothetical protein
MNKKLKLQITFQAIFWLSGMLINYLIDGHVLVGGLMGAMAGIIMVLINNR